ncbi:MAG: SDR family oxidoreductase [Candidatus Hydrogenedentota bacterium]
MNKVAFITGASRGIGKCVGHKLASNGWDIVVAAKSTEENPKLPGTIFTAADELSEHGTDILPVRCDVTDLESIQTAVDATLDHYGRIDAVINNAGALWWKNMDETPMKRYDLINNVNARGSFAVTQAFLPTMQKQKSGHVICMSPPYDEEMFPGHIAYCISKFGMTMMAQGISMEMKDYNIHGSALWPHTMIESLATINWGLGDTSTWRKADILADATFEILQHPELSSGKALLDEHFLRLVGYTDFDQYLCEPGGKPQVISRPNQRAQQAPVEGEVLS